MTFPENEQLLYQAYLANNKMYLDRLVDMVGSIEDLNLQQETAEKVGKILVRRMEHNRLDSSSLDIDHADRDYTDGEIACMALARYASDVPSKITLDQ